MPPIIRDYRPADAASLTDLFYDTVHALADDLYTRDQILAWAPLPRDYAGWRTRLDRLCPFVAELAGTAVGFMSLEADGHIDLAFTHRDRQGSGIGGALYAHLESAARDLKIETLHVEASQHAKPFFLARQFSVVRRNEIHKNGQVLINWTMKKRLG